MNVISRSPESVSTTHIMNWMIACIIFVFFAIIEYGLMLLCRFVFDYKSFAKDYARKRLMQVDFICLITSMISFLIFIILSRVKFSSTVFEISVTVTNASGIPSVGLLYSHMGAHFEAL